MGGIPVGGVFAAVGEVEDLDFDALGEAALAGKLWDSLKFFENLWNFSEFLGILLASFGIPWNSSEFFGLLRNSSEFLGYVLQDAEKMKIAKEQLVELQAQQAPESPAVSVEPLAASVEQTTS